MRSTEKYPMVLGKSEANGSLHAWGGMTTRIRGHTAAVANAGTRAESTQVNTEGMSCRYCTESHV